jgi:pyruvate dehydrogenase E2 component (dihydrolipoamide acetyltransferase)
VISEFRLPDLGEGLPEAEIVQWLVAEGDTVTLNQPIAEVETAKAIVELPSPFAGTVRQLHAETGTVVEVESSDRDRGARSRQRHAHRGVDRYSG